MKTASIVCLLSCCAALLTGWPVSSESLPGRSVSAAEATQLTGGQCVQTIDRTCGNAPGCKGNLIGFCIDGSGGSKPTSNGVYCNTNCNIYSGSESCVPR